MSLLLGVASRSGQGQTADSAHRPDRSRLSRCPDSVPRAPDRLGSPESAQADPRRPAADAERTAGPDVLGADAREGGAQVGSAEVEGEQGGEAADAG